MLSHEMWEFSCALATGIAFSRKDIVNFREAVLGLVNPFAFYLAPCLLILEDRISCKRVGIDLEVLVFVGRRGDGGRFALARSVASKA